MSSSTWESPGRLYSSPRSLSSMRVLGTVVSSTGESSVGAAGVLGVWRSVLAPWGVSMLLVLSLSASPAEMAVSELYEKLPSP